MSFHALRRIPVLEAVLKETLRLHPPLILLLRVARGDYEVGGYRIADGDLVGATPPAISNRIPPEDFPNPPDSFDPGRYIDRTRRTSSTAGHGFRSAPAATAASVPRSR